MSEFIIQDALALNRTSGNLGAFPVRDVRKSLGFPLEAACRMLPAELTEFHAAVTLTPSNTERSRFWPE